MKTLIFATDKNRNSRNSNEMITEFIKEGDIVDAMNYFDGSRRFGNFFHNDEEGYWFANNDNGNHRERITDAEIENDVNKSIDVDIYTLWTKTIDNLSLTELKAVLKDGDKYTAAEALEAYGFNVDAYEVAKHFDDLEFFFDYSGNDYIEKFYNVSDVMPEDEDDHFEYKGKFYTEK